MSRNVPMNKPLSDVDRRYLRHVGAHGANLEARVDAEYPPDPDALEAFNKKLRKELAGLNGMGLTAKDQSDLADENARLRAELDAMRAQQTPADSDEATDAPPPPDYTGWTKAQLEEEIDRVNGEDPDAGLAKGNKEPMIEALTAYFAE